MEYKNRAAHAWQPPIEKYYEVEKDAYELIFDQAKDRFEDISTESESITDKAMKMLTWLGALAGFYVGFLAQHKDNNLALFLPLIFFGVDAVLLLLLIAPKEIKNRGLAPVVAIPDKLDMEEKENQAKLVYLQHLIIVQDNITYMQEKNKSRTRIYRWAQIVLIVLISAVAATVPLLLGNILGRQ